MMRHIDFIFDDGNLSNAKKSIKIKFLPSMKLLCKQIEKVKKSFKTHSPSSFIRAVAIRLRSIRFELKLLDATHSANFEAVSV